MVYQPSLPATSSSIDSAGRCRIAPIGLAQISYYRCIRSILYPNRCFSLARRLRCEFVFPSCYKERIPRGFCFFWPTTSHFYDKPSPTMSQQRGPYQPMPSQWTDVSKVLALEVKEIMTDVNKLREERTKLQQEIGDLTSMRAKLATGLPPEIWAFLQGGGSAAISPPPEEPPPPPEPEQQIVAARPAWRTVEQPRAAPKKKARGYRAEPPPPPPPAPVEPPRVQAWANWKPNPMYAPVAKPSAPAPKPGPPGLFGPRTPPP